MLGGKCWTTLLLLVLASCILSAHQNRHVSMCAASGLKRYVWLPSFPGSHWDSTIKRLAAVCVFTPSLKADPVAPIFLINCSYKWNHWPLQPAGSSNTKSGVYGFEAPSTPFPLPLTIKWKPQTAYLMIFEALGDGEEKLYNLETLRARYLILTF